MKVYVASSWRNELQPEVVNRLGVEGHRVYDFRHPSLHDQGFHWSEIGPEWQSWTPAQFRDALQHPIACRGFAKDMTAIEAADAIVLIMPCGRSAHLEFGYAVGKGKLGVILLSGGELELMYRMADNICVTIGEVVAALRCPTPASREDR